MEKDVLEAISDIEEQIDDLKSQKELIESFDFSKPVDEDTWHRICETPLRSSNLLAVLVKNIFPEAEDILVHANYVYFNLLGFKIQIPTSYCRGINVDTGWYVRDQGEPKMYLTESQELMKQYFEALDNGANWRTLAKIRLRCYKDWFIPFAWWFKYKWKDPHRNDWEKLISEKKENLENQKVRYHQTREEMLKRTIKLKDELLPMINKFSEQHFKYNSSYGYSIEEVISFELSNKTE